MIETKLILCQLAPYMQLSLFLHFRHDMQTIVIDAPVTWCVSQSVSLSVCLSLACALQKTAEKIDVMFEVETRGPQTHSIRWLSWHRRRRGVVKNVSIVYNKNTTFPIHSPDDSTFDAASARLLWPLLCALLQNLIYHFTHFFRLQSGFVTFFSPNLSPERGAQVAADFGATSLACRQSVSLYEKWHD